VPRWHWPLICYDTSRVAVILAEHKEATVLRASLLFFLVGLVSMILGATGIAGFSMEIGRTLLFFFIVLSVLSFIFGVIRGRRPKLP